MKQTHMIKKNKSKKQKASELEAYGEYSMFKWAYYYAYPEYFPAHPYPRIPSEHTEMNIIRKQFAITTNPDGLIAILYSPGLIGLKDQNSLGRTLNIFKKISQITKIPAEVEADQRLMGSPENMALRICGGYLKIAPLLARGNFLYGTFLRTTELLPAINYPISCFSKISQNGQQMIVRYRGNRYNNRLNTPEETIIYHLIIGCGLIPNSIIELEVEETFESLVPMTSDYCHEKFEMVPQKSVSDSVQRAEYLINNIPQELISHPLENPMLYHDELFLKTEQNCYFSDKIAQNYSKIMEQNTFVIHENLGMQRVITGTTTPPTETNENDKKTPGSGAGTDRLSTL